jgi:hypothetical protein
MTSSWYYNKDEKKKKSCLKGKGLSGKIGLHELTTLKAKHGITFVLSFYGIN